MILHFGILILAGILLPVLLYFESTENRKGLVPAKTSLSMLFVLTALVQAHPHPAYYHFLLLGLLFCLGGDVCLTSPKMFLMGLVAFLVGHVFYIIAFFHLSCFNTWTWIGAALFFIISGCIYLWLSPHLGPMKGPVGAYVGVISVMAVGAFTIMGDPRLPLTARGMVFSGALAFYASDIFVARDRFIKKETLNRFLGLPLYYGGQFFLAFSVSHVG